MKTTLVRQHHDDTQPLERILQAETCRQVVVHYQSDAIRKPYIGVSQGERMAKNDNVLTRWLFRLSRGPFRVFWMSNRKPSREDVSHEELRQSFSALN